ncbi:sulfatase family protein [Tichowtungia aerotolerans]|uniref:Sulfatase-like hydrolase/transferase n=1 Tax=Tichowtungia aerotolerans TaxID=2697043 RepID=A0A6P1MA20_9BACT|nr:sulfatase [Tichowtungia aerotolerans]QHI70681.1 sulfatase-like hydrolase/transferase [Tichowtungia aerotolerans]
MKRMVKAGLVCMAALGARADKQPNFVLLLTDDQSYHLGMLGVPGLKTPNIDALAKQGTFFTKAYSSAASCAPCRGSILTGMFPSANGHWRNTVGPILSDPDVQFSRQSKKADQVGVHEDIPTLIEVLNKNEYFTGITEKWHLSPPWKFPFLYRNMANLKPFGSAAAVADFIKKAGGRPFFIQCNVDNTHRPYRKHIQINPDLPRVNPADVELPPHWPDTPKTRQDYAEYLTTVQHADAVIGAIFQTLEKAGVLENTYIIYSSDQGYCYHRAKATAYDAGVHVPLSITGPGVQSNAVCDALVGHIDLMPTILDYAGIQIPETVQGFSLKPVLEGRMDDVGRKYLISEHNAHGGNPVEYYPTRSVTDGRFRYIWNIHYAHVPDFDIDSMVTDPNFRKVPHQPAWMPWDALPSDIWQNNACEEIILHKEEFPEAYRLLKESMFRPEFELYDLEKDPYETKNLAANPEYASLVKRMDKALHTWMDEEGDIGDPRSVKRRAQ